MTDVAELVHACLIEHAAHIDVPSTLIPAARRKGRVRRLRRGFMAVGVAVGIGGALGLVVTTSFPHVGGHPARVSVGGSVTSTEPSPPATVNVAYDKTNGVTCVTLVFTETGDSTSVTCGNLDAGQQKSGIVGAGADYRVRTRTGAPASDVVTGALVGDGTVVVTDETGAEIPVTMVPAPAYPYRVFFADLGDRKARSVTYIAPNGDRKPVGGLPSRAPTPSP